MKSLKHNFRYQNLIILQNKYQTRNQRQKRHLVTYSDLFNSKKGFFQNLISEVSRYVDKPNDQILQNVLFMRDTENIEHLSRNIFKKKRYSSCFNSILLQNLFSLRKFLLQKSFHFFFNSLSNTNFNSNDWKSSKSFQCLLYQLRILSNSMYFFFVFEI